MGGRNMALSVVVRLRDMMSGPLSGLRNKLKSVADMGRKIGLIGGAIAALSFAAPLQSAAAYNDSVRDIAITAGLAGKEATAYVTAQTRAYDKLALKVGQGNARIVEGAQLLIAAGMEEPLVNRLLPAVGRTATAANATMEDTAKTAFALSNTLNIPVEQMETAMGKLITAGKLGRFEFKDMAKSFPELTSQVKKLGLEGQEAVATLGASLQVAMYGTDSPDSAANNFKNFLNKITAPDTVKRFAKAGLDLPTILADATAKGINPVEAMFEKIRQATNVSKKDIDAIYSKAKASGKTDKEAEAEVKERMQRVMASTELGKLFGDMQVLDFLVPLLANLDKYKEFKKEIGGAGADVIDTDFNTRMDGEGKKLEMIMERLTQLQQRIGQGFAGNLDWVGSALDGVIAGVDWIEQKFPGLLPIILSVVGGMLMLGAAVAVLTPVFTALAAVFGVLFSPIGLILAGLALLAAAAYTIYANWDEFGQYFKAMWSGVKNIFGGYIDVIAGLLTGDFGRAWNGVKRIFSGLGQWFQGGWSVIGGLFRRGIQALDSILGTDIWGTLVSTTEALAGKLAPAWDAAMAALDGDFGPAKKLFDDFVSWLSGWGERLGTDLVNAIAAAKDGVVAAFADMWAAAKDKFWEFIGDITAGLSSLPGKIKNMFSFGGGSSADDNIPAATGDGPPEFGDNKGFAPGIGGTRGFAKSTLGGGKTETEVGGRIVVSAAEGARIVNTESTNPAVPLSPDRGTVLGRP